MRQIEFAKIADIPTFSRGFSPVARSISNDGAALFLFVENSAKEEVSETFSQGFGVFPMTRMVKPARFGLVRLKNTEISKTELPDLDTTFPLIDVFQDGRILVAGCRSEWRSENDYDLNGVIFNPITGDESRILLGDGIENVAIDSLSDLGFVF